MSLTYDPEAPAHDRSSHERAMSTTDIESTMDLQGAHTTDLSPVTSDIDGPLDASIDDPSVVASSGLRRVDDGGSDLLDRNARTHDTDFAVREIPGLAPSRRPAAQPLTTGAVLLDRFIVERVVGSGGTAVVYQARDMAASDDGSGNVRIALKAPRPDRDRARAAGRLQHEFEQARKLSHPAIVRVFELHEYADTRFMTMELIEGRLLSTLVRDWTMLPRALANKILHTCAQALIHAHEHDVVHGDFKPGNVFVTRDEAVKIVDFGAAAALSGGSSRIPAGTPAYASPQVLSGETPDRRDDVFSFACVAYELLTGQHPFQHRSSLEARDAGATPTRAWNLTAPQWLALLSGLAWDREQRPPDLDTLLESLLGESEPIAVAPPIRPSGDVVVTELQPELMQSQRGWGFFVFVACAIVVIFIAAQRQNRPDDDPAVAATDSIATESALPPLSNSMAGSVERSREPLSPLAGSEPFAADGKLFSGETTRPFAADGKPAASTAALSPLANPEPPAAAPPKRSTPPGPLSEISFESASIVTTESSVAAVFLIKRSQPLRGRVRVQWKAESGTADAGIDFASNASGSVEFADGQAQRAIYVPLRNDLLKEGDETFIVKLLSPQNARLGAIASAEATIKDDDAEATITGSE